MKLIRKIIVVFTLLIGSNIFAQQQPQYTQYMFNTMSLNSAYTGSTDALEAYILHRSQWVGFDGAPTTQSFGIHSPVSDRVGLGFSGIHDEIGPSSETNLEANFSYSLNLNYDTKLAFGVNAGINLLSIDWSEGIYNNSTDAAFNEDISGKVRPTVGAGIYVYNSNWYGGISALNLIQNNFYDDVQEDLLDREIHFYAIGGYVFTLSENLLFKPAVMAKIIQSTPVTVDVSANFLISEKFTTGVSYRYDDAFSGILGFQITPSIYIGYAYDRSITDLQKYNDGSHEFILKFQLNRKNTNLKSPRFF